MGLWCQSTSVLRSLISGGSVVCKGLKQDRYKRLIAVCFSGHKDLNAELVKQGWALAYRKYSIDYVPQERNAESEKVGIWSGEFVTPWEWRKGKRLKSKLANPCCKICRKGEACGNSCISRRSICHKPFGCACNAN